MVSLHLSSTALAASLSGLGDELELRRARGEELEVFTRMWQCRADAWGGVAVWGRGGDNPPSQYPFMLLRRVVGTIHAGTEDMPGRCPGRSLAAVTFAALVTNIRAQANTING